MYQHRRLSTSSFSFFQKFKNFDYILLVCILLLGFISLATMYSTDGGKILFHTKSHFTKLIIFTIMMLIISFINIKFWFLVGYLFYIVVIGLLLATGVLAAAANSSLNEKGYSGVMAATGLSYLSFLTSIGAVGTLLLIS